MRSKFRASLTVVAGGIGILTSGCRTPTQVTVEITTDVPCSDIPDTTVQVGRIGPDLETRPVSIATRTCTPGGRIGSVVIAPSGGLDDEFAVKVILGHRGRTASGCRMDEPEAGALPGCILARRGLHYLPHTELKLPIALRADCSGVVCRNPSETCVHGSCVRAIIDDPRVCIAGCDDGVLRSVDAGTGVPDSGADVGGVDGDAQETGLSGGDATDADTGVPISDACAGGACTPPSCATPLVCGAAGDSCCESPLVPGGDFLRQNKATFPAKVSTFRLDKYETTVGRFRAFVAATVATSWHPPIGSGKHVHLSRGGLYSVKELALEQGWNPAWDAKLPSKTGWNDHLNCVDATWTPEPAGNEQRPIVCVNWYDAYAFCIWDGGFLPSYAEWNYAFVGGGEQRDYPWGDSAPDLNHTQYCGTTPCPTVVNVGFKVPGNGRYGQSDLSGNVWEWMLDAYPPVSDGDCADCVFFDAGTNLRTSVGSAFDGANQTLAADVLTSDAAEYLDKSNGFRCARPP